MKTEVKNLLLKLHSRIIARENEGNEFLNQMLTSMASVPGFEQNVMRGEQYHNEASMYYNQSDYSKAFELFSNAIQKYPNAGSYYSRGVTAMDLNDIERAIADFSSAIQFDENYVNAYHNRALCFLQLIESFDLKHDVECKPLVDFARNDLKKAISLGNPESKRFLDMSYND
ncbi:MAG: tetratricopeptide repeat protein [Clostridiaceae bacterium]|nr:tetratricopeptide repeat protein [Clostridiaceae bacterium]